METLKLFYAAFGVDHPQISIVVVTVLGMLIGLIIVSVIRLFGKHPTKLELKQKIAFDLFSKNWRLSFSIGAIVGGLVFGGTWYAVGKDYDRSHNFPESLQYANKPKSTTSIGPVSGNNQINRSGNITEQISTNMTSTQDDTYALMQHLQDLANRIELEKKSDLHAQTIGDNTVVIGATIGNVGNGSIVIGPTGSHGNIILDKPMTIGNGAQVNPTSITIGNDAKSSDTIAPISQNAPNGIATINQSGGNNTVYNLGIQRWEIAPELLENLTEQMRPFSSGKDRGDLITCLMGDTEGMLLANQLGKAFQDAGWHIKDKPESSFYSQTLYNNPIIGFILVIHSKESLPAGIQELIGILNRAGIKPLLATEDQFKEQIPSSDFRIIIGKKTSN